MVTLRSLLTDVKDKDEHHLKANHIIDWDSATCVTDSTYFYQGITLENWFSSLEQTALNRCQALPAPYKQLLNSKTLFIINLATNGLHNTSSQPITSRVYQRLLYRPIKSLSRVLNLQLKLSLDSEDGFRTGCRNVSRQQQSFLGLQSPR